MNAHNRKAITERLQSIMERDRILLVDAVIADAKNLDSPLHETFEWEDTQAAHKWRQEQARQLIRSVHVSVRVESHTIAVPRYVRSPDVHPAEQGYGETAYIKSDREKAVAALQYELEKAAAAIHRCEAVALALDLSDTVDELLEQIFRLRMQTAVA